MDKMVYELLKEVRDDVKKHGEHLATQGVCILNIEKNVNKNTKDLEYHITRTNEVQRSNDLLTDLHLDNQKRITNNEKKIDKLEEPGKVEEYLSKVWIKKSGKVIGVLTIVSLIAGIITKIIGYW